MIKNRNKQHVAGSFGKQKMYCGHTTQGTDWGTIHQPTARSIKEERLGEQAGKTLLPGGTKLKTVVALCCVKSREKRRWPNHDIN